MSATISSSALSSCTTNSQKLKHLYPNSNDDEYLKRNAQQGSNSSPSQNNQPQRFEQHDIECLQGVLGPQTKTWDFSEECLKTALEVRVQQEKTKQEYYKTEQLGRTFEIMKMAVHAKIPGHLIPTLFNVSDDTLIKLNELQLKQLGHDRSRSLQGGFKPQHERTPSKLKNNPMANFRFGSGSSTSLPPRVTSLPVRHQLSPSRIGAQAISTSLASAREKPSQPRLSNLRHGANHLRTTSLPSSVCIPETRELKFSESEVTIEKRQRLEITIPDLQHATPKKRKCVDDPDSELPTPNGPQRTTSGSLFFETPIKRQTYTEESCCTPPDSKAGSPLREEASGELQRTYSLPKFPNDILS